MRNKVANFRGSDEVTTPRRQVLTALRDLGPQTRIELARQTGLSPTTMTRVVAQLIDDKCIAEGETVSRRGTGRPGTEISIVADSYFVVGVQIGIGFVRLGISDLLGNCAHIDGFSYQSGTPAGDVLAQVGHQVVNLCRSAGIPNSQLLGVGVAVPGPVDQQQRRLLYPINLDWRDVPVADLLEPIVGVPVVVEHNVRAMALAETRFGLGKEADSVAFVYLRTGIGAGLVVDGQAFLGGVHGAIELGHLRVVDGGARCVCGSTGCLETLFSEDALRRRLERHGIDPGNQQPFAVMLEAAKTNTDLHDEVTLLTNHLATGLSALINLLTPEIMVLGGALSLASDEFVENLAMVTRDAVFPVIRPTVNLRRASLGMDAGVNGGATVALDRFFYI